MHYVEMPSFSESDIARFWRHVDIKGDAECWPWKYSQFTGGYGQIKIFRKNLKAHRVAYFLSYKIDPGQLLVCHKCDNPCCCNPKHLFLGSEADNTDDARTKHRLKFASGINHGSVTHPERFARGEKVHGAKLSEEIVAEIRRLYSTTKITQQQLAHMYGVSRREIGGVIRGEKWRHAIPVNQEIDLSNPNRRGKPGSSHHKAILTETDIPKIRALHAEGVSQIEIARLYSVSTVTISHIINRRTWKHVT